MNTTADQLNREESSEIFDFNTNAYEFHSLSREYHFIPQQLDEIGKITSISAPNQMNFIGKRPGTRADISFSTKSYEYHLKTVKVTISAANHENVTA